MKSLIAFILVSSCTAPVYAGIPPVNALTYTRVRTGELFYPAPFCPGVNKRYEDLTEQLAQVKASIRQTQKNCTTEKSKVDGFAKLIEDGRTKFWNLVQKGRSQELSASESKELTDYVDAVTKAGGTIVDLTAGSGCFKDDPKGLMTVDLVSSIITEATTAIATVAGPYGAAVSMGGKLTASLLVSIDRVARSRSAYDFDDPDQRKTFMKTLCAYNGFRASLDEISRPDSIIRDNNNYLAELNAAIERTERLCPECRALIQKYKTEYRITPAKPRLSLLDTATKLEPDIDAIESIYQQRIGLATVRNLYEADSTREELKRLNDLLSDLGDVERDRVVQMQDVIEDFLFSKWLPKFVDHQRKELSRRSSALYLSLWNLNEISIYIHEPYLYPQAFLTLEELIQELYAPGTFPYAYDQARKSVTPWSLSMQAEVSRRLGEIVSSLQIVEKSCQFVRAIGVRYENGMHQACDINAKRTLESTYFLLWKLKSTTHKDSAVINTAFEVPSPALLEWAKSKKIDLPKKPLFAWTANWIQSLTRFLEATANNPDELVFERR